MKLRDLLEGYIELYEAGYHLEFIEEMGDNGVDKKLITVMDQWWEAGFEEEIFDGSFKQISNKNIEKFYIHIGSADDRPAKRYLEKSLKKIGFKVDWGSLRDESGYFYITKR